MAHKGGQHTPLKDGPANRPEHPLQKGRDLLRSTVPLTYLAGVTPVQVLEEHQSTRGDADERGARNVHVYSAGRLWIAMDDAPKIHFPRNLQTKRLGRRNEGVRLAVAFALARYDRSTICRSRHDECVLKKVYRVTNAAKTTFVPRGKKVLYIECRMHQRCAAWVGKQVRNPLSVTVRHPLYFGRNAPIKDSDRIEHFSKPFTLP